MKKTFRLFIAAFAAVTALVSCAKTIDADVAAEPQEGDGMRVITIVSDAKTKTGPSYDDWHKPVFVNGDQIKVMNDSDSEVCTVYVYDGNVTFRTSLTGELTAVYPKEKGTKSGRGQTITVSKTPKHFQDGTLASGHIASATIPSGSYTAVFHNETALLRIFTLAGTKQFTITSASENISDGVVNSNGDISSDARKSIVVGDGTKELGTCYVSISPGANLNSLTFDAGSETKTVSASVVTKAGVAYTINWRDALSGKFSVGADRQVQFSKGNLQATYDGGKYSWGFAANQYDYVGAAAGNTTIGSQRSGAVVDLFGWSTAATYFGINTSTDNADYSGDFVDWGKNIGDGSTWRTLSKDEWVYLFKARVNASSLYKYGVTVCDKTNCVIIAPDGYTGSIASSYDASAWSAAEAAGLVCLPAEDYRYGSWVLTNGVNGDYWSSAAYDSDHAYNVSFGSNGVYPGNSCNRNNGFSVRLITDVAGSAPEEPVHEDPLSGKFSVSSTKQVQFSKGNLQATYDGSKYSWGFAAHQYDYIGDAAGNTTIDCQTSGKVVDLFGWSTAATYFGINTSSSNSAYSGDFVDWGKKIGDGSTWRTLTTEEWEYLFVTRTNASSLYKYGVTVCGKTNCLIIAPDGFTGTIAYSYNAWAWPAAEAAGLVCLPAAGHRSGSDFYNVGNESSYWSSSESGSNYACYMNFNSSHVIPAFGGASRFFGYSVRLITECQ